MVYKRQPGWSLHLYLLGSQKPPVPQTHTWDIPIPTPQPAPDPTKIPVGKDEDIPKTRVFNIVKTYRDRITDEDDKEVVTHVATFSRTNNPAIITIEDEPTYKVKEWFISETYNNPAKETTWEDNHNQAPTTGSTGTKPSLTEIKPKNTTLYVLLEKKVGDDKTNTAGPLVIEESQVTKAVETIKSDVTGWGPKTMTFSAADITQNNNISIQYDTPLIR